jgi:23S rRNA pseudouridine2605 synthase
MRIQKWLSELGVLSRRQAEAYIKENRIQVNGVPATIGMLVNSDDDQITIDGKLQRKAEGKPSKVYLAFNKPDFTLVSRTPQNGMETIYDVSSLRKIPFRLNAVGRLDYRTEGLLLLTNDGELIHKLSHPSSGASRVYHVLVSKKLTKEELDLLNSQGLILDGRPVRCEVSSFCRARLGKTVGSWYEVTVFEGRNRLIRRMFEKLERRVVRLVRISYAGVNLPQELKPGAYEALSSEEVARLKRYMQ